MQTFRLRKILNLPNWTAHSKLPILLIITYIKLVKTSDSYRIKDENAADKSKRPFAYRHE